MRWRSGRRSQNVEDRRGMRVSRRGLAGGGIGTIVVVLVALYLGVDPGVIMQGLPQGEVSQSSSEPYRPSPAEQELAVEDIVLVAVLSAHRAAAFEACEFLMDWLKTSAPFWKLETRGADASWVEARDSDDAARERWRKGASRG